MPEWLLQLATTLVVGGAAYGAVRADLRSMKERVERVEGEADRAHKRVDDLLMKGA